METDVIRKHFKRLKNNGCVVKLFVNLTYRAKFGGTDGKPLVGGCATYWGGENWREHG